jgi:hypothetical protein
MTAIHLPNEIMRHILSYQFHGGKEKWTKEQERKHPLLLIKRPNVFKGVGWAYWELRDSLVTPEIIRNVNYFIEKYSIVKSSKLSIKLQEQYDFQNIKIRRYIDHPRVFKTNYDETILIVSPYITPNMKEYNRMKRLFDCINLRPFKRLYAYNASTFVSKNIRCDIDNDDY